MITLLHFCNLLTFLSHFIKKCCNFCVLFGDAFLYPLNLLFFLGKEIAIEAQIFLGKEYVIVKKKGILDESLQIRLRLILRGSWPLHLSKEFVHLTICEFKVVKIA